MAFWRRKKEDRFITLGLSDTAPAAPAETSPVTGERLQPPTGAPAVETLAPAMPAIEPTATGGEPTPAPHVEAGGSPPAVTSSAVEQRPQARPAPPPPPPASESRREQNEQPRAETPPQKPVPSRSPFQSSVLGLDRTSEELQAEIDALEETYALRFQRAIEKTRESLSEKIDTVFQGRKVIDAELLDELEEALIAADIGVQTTTEILETVRRGVTRKEIGDVEALKAAIRNELLSILRASEREGVASETGVPEDVTPYVMMIVGVNGVGKTTTIGKLAQRIKAEGNDVLICAADTFRAAASDQLAIWAERTGVPLIQQKSGTDPAAVLFDALKAAKARKSDVLIVDTAGRLHNKSNLMAELEKMKRVAGREVSGAPHETLLVVDAVTGQNGLEQARQFLKTAGVTGIVLTKLDGTAKGGIAVAIARELSLPIRYAGIGEKVDDLVVFDPEQYVNGLFA
ncbi:MAG TPA: signal recognition particle-docking protein FtsY [Pyrinomonadaceae bacterium]|nr:signal recognition particle-docking protein FtsY [Pyrinomonadaceae bacterium]